MNAPAQQQEGLLTSAALGIVYASASWRVLSGTPLLKKQGHTLHICGYGPVLLILRFLVLRRFFAVGPPMICPKEFNCPLVENTVARRFSSTCSFIYASKI